MKTLLRTHELCRDFVSGEETVRAVHGVSLAVAGGRLTVVCGPSGSGKTTLLNLLGALDAPTAGTVWFEDRDVTRLQEEERDELRRARMGFVFQGIGLISMLSALENVEFALRVCGRKAAGRGGAGPGERTARADACLEAVGMHKRRHHRPHELSVGEQQRVAIARAMAHRPDVIFADEPTSALDTHLGLQVVTLFKELVAREGTSVVMATHNPHFMELADALYTLENGRLVGKAGA